MARKRRERKPLKRVVIVCGSEKTEPIYFKSFKNHLRTQRIHVEGIEVLPSATKNQSPDKLLERACTLADEYDLDYKNGDTVWCVFDYDDFHKKIQSNIHRKKFRKIIKIISVRCFEVWYLSHFKYSTKYYRTTEEIEADISHEMGEEYKKNKDYFPELLSKQSVAIENAKRLEKHHLELGNQIPSSDSNPITNVYELVEFLNEFQ